MLRLRKLYNMKNKKLKDLSAIVFWWCGSIFIRRRARLRLKNVLEIPLGSRKFVSRRGILYWISRENFIYLHALLNLIFPDVSKAQDNIYTEYLRFTAIFLAWH